MALDIIDMTYIIGAGASVPYGMPTGAGLKKQIISYANSAYTEFKSGRIDQSYPGLLDKDPEDGVALDSFRKDFSLSPVTSIDAFLAAQPQYTSVGKYFISLCLIEAEKNSQIDLTPEGCWLSYLFNAMELNRKPERLSRIRFISFNYDRLIERFFDSAAKSTFGDGTRQYHKLIDSLSIVRIHGDLGAYNRKDFNFAKANPFDRKRANTAMANIQIVHEGEESTVAKSILSRSMSIISMGLGYSADNLAKIWPRHFEVKPEFKGTGYGMKKGERERVKFISRGTTAMDDGELIAFEDEDCLSLLRNYNCVVTE